MPFGDSFFVRKKVCLEFYIENQSKKEGIPYIIIVFGFIVMYWNATLAIAEAILAVN